MFTGSSNFGRISVAASSTPMFVPTGLNAWAKLSLRVAVSSGPSDKHVRVGGRLENRAPRGDREQGDQERLVGHDLARRVEGDRAGRSEKHTGEKPGLVAEPLIDERCGDRQQEVRAEVRQLHQRGLEGVHLEDALEARHHRRGEVGGHPPGGEAADEDGEQYPHPRIDQPCFARRGPVRRRADRRAQSSSCQYLSSLKNGAAPRCINCDLGHATHMSRPKE